LIYNLPSPGFTFHQQSVYLRGMTVYFIAGIGADWRLFTHIALPASCQRAYIHWLPPQRGEDLPRYAARLAGTIRQEEPFALVGFSLGGMVAVEIAKITSPVCTIIVGSIAVHRDAPPAIRIGRRLPVHRLFPPVFMKVVSMIKHTLTLKEAANRQLMRQIIWAGSSRFIYWAMQAVVDWRNETVPENLYHIHGTHDLVFPLRYTRADYVIEGGHLLVMANSGEVSRVLGEILEKVRKGDGQSV